MIIVTGGTHGIGRACVELLAQRGETVVFTGRDVQAGQQIAAAMPGAHYVSGDVGVEEECRAVVERALALGDGRIDGLVNNAGLGLRKPFAESTAADWEQVMNVNARSTFLFTRHALAGLRRARGSVVNVASVAGKAGEEGLSLYCASKAAVIGLTQALALEHGDELRFNAVCPGQIATRMMAKVTGNDLVRRQLEARIPAGRLGEAGEVADVIAWLLSPQASYVNGIVLTIDGGETAGIRPLRVAAA
jgi:NAD(P)-dependent dehydrogenase (short-subunit alcohol dehydrogenase family)